MLEHMYRETCGCVYLKTSKYRQKRALSQRRVYHQRYPLSQGRVYHKGLGYE